MRRSLILLLAGLAGVTAFQPCPLRPRSNAPKLPSTSYRSISVWGTRMNSHRDGSEERGLQDALRMLARGVARGMLLVSAVLGGGVMPAGAASDYDAQTVKQQLERLDKVEQKELRDELTNPGNVIAKGIIRLPSNEELPLGPNTAGAYNLALGNDGAALLLTAYEIKEPTPEFKATMAKMEALEKKELEKKKAWKDLVTKLAGSKTENEIVTSLDSLTSFVRTEQGLPTGIKRQAVVTEIRGIKKAGKENKIWNKDAEISYEDLIRIINYMQSPNTSRDPQARVL